jgi:hypothetical protein
MKERGGYAMKKKENTGIVLKGHVSHHILNEGDDGGIFPLDGALGGRKGYPWL